MSISTSLIASLALLWMVGGNAVLAEQTRPVEPVLGSGDEGVESGEAAPAIRFDRETVNFGRALEGESLVHLFTVYNDGEGPLIIQEVKPT